jgi:hypothetical protein
MKTSLMALLLWACSTLAQALPDAVRQSEATWRQWGSGEMSWLGFPIYRATLWVAGAPTTTPATGATSALQLDYLRDIPRERLVQTSVDEMRRLGASEAQLQRWERAAARLSRSEGGREHRRRALSGRGAAFYHRGRATGEVADAEFARLFFAIWLDPRSRSPSLRAALLKRPES